MYSSLLLALVSSALLGSAGAANVPQGFNYGNMKAGQVPKVQADYEKEFAAALALSGTNGAFSSARLYTMIQAGTKDDPNEAIPAALKTKGITLLLGMWCSGDPAGFANELSALKKAIAQYPGLIDIMDGISVGSEDLYRDSTIGIMNKSGVGAGPDVIVSYIKQVRAALASSEKADVKKAMVGHVDTWTAWVNGTNKEVVDNCDWVGVDAYPYWQSTMPNDISVAGSLFFEAMDKTEAAAGGKPVWITETGWPVEGNKSNLAVADVQDAKMFYQGVGCKILGSKATWWYILNEAGASPDFSVADTNYKPLYDLNCADAKKADPLMAGSSGSSNSSNSSSGNSSSSGTSVGVGSSSTATSNSSSPTGTGKSAASASHAANCMFALVLAGVVALMI